MTYVILTLIVGIMALSALNEHLSPDEAQFLNRVIEQETSVDLPIRLQSMWADFCGLMERPTRLLGLWTALGGLLILLATIRRGGGSSFQGIVTVGVFGVFMSSAVNIGGSAPSFFALAVVIFWVQQLTRWSLGHLAILAIIGIVGAQAALGTPDQAPFSWSSFLSLGPNLTPLGLPLWLGSALTISFLVGGLLAKRAFLGLIFMTAGLLAPPVAQYFALPLAPPAWILASYGIPAALLLSQRTPGATTPWLSGVALTLTLLVLGTTGYQAATAEKPSADRERLDWVASHLPQSTWLVLDGNRKAVLRFYEHSGHRTGHRSILIRHQKDRETLVRVALSEKPPLICLIGSDPNSIAGLLDRYELVSRQDHPDDILVWKFKRRAN